MSPKYVATMVSHEFNSHIESSALYHLNSSDLLTPTSVAFNLTDQANVKFSRGFVLVSDLDDK